MASKKGHKIGEVCKLLELQPYVLRYWETEFRALQAPSGGGGQRLYRESDLALLRRIKQLLYEEGYTIAGARKKLESETPGEYDPADPAAAPLFSDGAQRGPSESPTEALDTSPAERIETSRRELEAALADARAALALLGGKPS